MFLPALFPWHGLPWVSTPTNAASREFVEPKHVCSVFALKGFACCLWKKLIDFGSPTYKTHRHWTLTFGWWFEICFICTAMIQETWRKSSLPTWLGSISFSRPLVSRIPKDSYRLLSRSWWLRTIILNNAVKERKQVHRTLRKLPTSCLNKKLSGSASGINPTCKSKKAPTWLQAKEMHLCQLADLILVLGFVDGDPM